MGTMDEHGFTPSRPEPTLPDPGRENRPDPLPIITLNPDYGDDDKGDPKVAAITWAAIVGLALIVIAVWCVWHPGRFEDTDIEVKVFLTWFWVGLIPAGVAVLWTTKP